MDAKALGGRLHAAYRRIVGLWVGSTERRKMAILWLVGIATYPTLLTTVSPWVPIFTLPLQVISFAWDAFEFVVSLPARPGLLLGNLAQVAVNKITLFLSLAISDPLLALMYTIGPAVAAFVWVKLGGYAWRLRSAGGDAPEPAPAERTEPAE